MSEEIYIFLKQQSWKIKQQGQRSMNFSGKIEIFIHNFDKDKLMNNFKDSIFLMNPALTSN